MTDALPSPTLSRVLKGGLCAGCGGCAAVAGEKVTMAVSDAGYLRPIQSAALSPGEERALARVCPGHGVEVAAPTEARDDALWGPLVEVRTGHATDQALRFEASSGGGLSALLVFLIESGKADFVLQTAASAADPVANTSVITASREEILRAAGSRYAPSAPLVALSEAMARPGRGIFVGKPCDATAFRALAAERPEIGAKFPYVLSFFCAGVPSLKGAQQILTKLETDPEEVTAFRYRGRGWPGFAAAETQDGTTRKMTYAESWGGVLSKHVQFRCKICPDGTGAHADVVCADAWHCDERGYPLLEERDGISLIVSRNARGEALIREAMATGVIVAEPFPVERIAPMQPGQYRRKRLLLSRLMALATLLRPRPRYTGLQLGAAARMAGLGANLRSFLGTCRRIVIDRRE